MDLRSKLVFGVIGVFGVFLVFWARSGRSFMRVLYIYEGFVYLIFGVLFKRP